MANPHLQSPPSSRRRPGTLILLLLMGALSGQLAACWHSLPEGANSDPAEVMLSLRIASDSAVGASPFAHTLGKAILSHGPDSIGHDTLIVPIAGTDQTIAFPAVLTTYDSLWFSARVLSNTDTVVFDRQDTLVPIPRVETFALRLPMQRQAPVVYASPRLSDFAGTDSVSINFFYQGKILERIPWQMDSLWSTHRQMNQSKCVSFTLNSGILTSSGQTVKVMKSEFTGPDEICTARITTPVGRILLEFRASRPPYAQR